MTRNVRTQTSQTFEVLFCVRILRFELPGGSANSQASLSRAMPAPVHVLLAVLAVGALKNAQAAPALVVPCEGLTGVDYCTECAKPAGAAKPFCYLCHPTRASVWRKDGTISEVRQRAFAHQMESLVQTGCQDRSAAPGSCRPAARLQGAGWRGYCSNKAHSKTSMHRWNSTSVALGEHGDAARKPRVAAPQERPMALPLPAPPTAYRCRPPAVQSGHNRCGMHKCHRRPELRILLRGEAGCCGAIARMRMRLSHQACGGHQRTG